MGVCRGGPGLQQQSQENLVLDGRKLNDCCNKRSL